MLTSGVGNLFSVDVSHNETLLSKLPTTPRKRPFGENATWANAVPGGVKTTRGTGRATSHKTQNTTKPVKSALLKGLRNKAKILVDIVILSLDFDGHDDFPWFVRRSQQTGRFATNCRFCSWFNYRRARFNALGNFLFSSSFRPSWLLVNWFW